MKKREPIDDLFQDRLKDFSLEAPMHLWDNIAEAAIPETPKRKRKGLLWLWILPFLLLTGIGWAYFGHSIGENQAVELGKFPVPAELVIPAPNTSIATEATIDQPVAIQDQPTIKAPIANKKSFNTDDLKTAIVNSIAVANSKEDTGETTLSTVDHLENTVASTQSSDSKTINTTESTEVEPGVTPQENRSKVENVIADNSQQEPANSEETALPSWLLDPLSGPLLLIDNPIGDEVLSCPTIEAKSWLTTVDLMSSMDFVMRQLEAKEPGFEEYARLRNNTETFRHGVSVGMRFSTISEKGFAVRSGLNYSAINEQLNFKIKEEEKLTITTKYDVDGSIIGADTSIQLVGTYRIVNNRYTELDIPLLIGYEYVGEKISFSFNGGTFINMLSAQKGEFVSPNSEEPVSFSSSDPNSYRAFKNRVGLGLYGSMGIYLQVKDNFQVLLEPYAKWRPGSYTVDGYVLDQRFFTAGLFVGVRKRII